MTSISLQGEQLLEAVRASRPLTGRAAADPSGLAVLAAAGGALPEIVLPEELDLQPLRHLACAGDYALPFISPSRADGRGGTDLLSPVSAYTPRSEVLRGPRFPFWKIDVMPDQPRMPSGRRLRTTALLTGGGQGGAVMPSGRDGISVHPVGMLLVYGGMTLEQAVTQPRLHLPGLRGWIEAITAQIQPDTSVQLSQAG